MNFNYFRYSFKHKMNKFLVVLVFLNIIFGCNKNEVQPSENSVNDTEKAVPIKRIEPKKDSILITNQNFESAGFEVEIPNGFTAKPSIVSKNNIESFDSYFFESPDKKAKFYIYARKDFGNPNDIIFPNDKIPTQITKSGDTIIRSWTLNPNQQKPYFRHFIEKKFNDEILITGFLYKDSAVYHAYLKDFEKMNYSLNRK